MTATMVTRVPLCLALLGFISVVWTLNPDDPNVCSHWERSVTPPLESCGNWLTRFKIMCRLLVWKILNVKLLIFTSEKRGKNGLTNLPRALELLSSFPWSPSFPLLLSRLNAETCSDENFMNPHRGLNYTRKQFVCWEQTTRATFISTHPAFVFVFTHYYFRMIVYAVIWVYSIKKRKKNWTKQNDHKTFSGTSRVHHNVHEVP